MIWPVNSSVITKLLPLVTKADAVLTTPEPELLNPKRLIVTRGLTAVGLFVESPNVKSGMILQTKPKL